METVQSRANVVNQDLSGRMAVVKNSIDLEKIKKDAEKEADFWKKERQRAENDPTGSKYAQAVAIGKLNAKVVVNSALNPNDREHSTNWDFFKSVYNCDVEALERDMIDKEVADTGDGPIQYKNGAYEDKLKLKYRPQGDVTPVQLKVFENFCNALDAKWKKGGYKGDKKFVDEYCAKYGLKSTTTNSELASFEAIK